MDRINRREKQQGRRPGILAALAILTAAVLVAALVAWRMAAFSETTSEKPLTVAAQPAPTILERAPKPPPSVVPDPNWAPPRPAPGSLEARAFAVVYPEVVTVKPDDSLDARLQFWPVSVHRLDDNTLVLLSVAQILSIGDMPGEDLSHASQGFYSIAYLTLSPRLKLQGVPFIGQASMGGWGQPPDLKLLKGLDARPMVLVRGGATAQGDNDDWADLVLLGRRISDVVIVATDIPLEFDNGGAGGRCSIEGVIKPRTPGRSFVVRYAGTFRGEVAYRRSGATYRPPRGVPDLWDRCPKNTRPPPRG